MSISRSRVPPQVFPQHPASPATNPSSNSSRAPLTNASSTTNKAPPAAPNKSSPAPPFRPPPAKSVTPNAQQAPSKVSPVSTLNKAPPATPAGRALPASKAPTTSQPAPVASTSKTPPAPPPAPISHGVAESKSSTDTTAAPGGAHGGVIAPPTPPHPADLAKLSIDNHAAHIAAHQQAATIHTQHALNKIGAAVLAGHQASGVLSQIPGASGVLSQISNAVPGAAGVLGAVGSASGLLASVAPTLGAASGVMPGQSPEVNDGTTTTTTNSFDPAHTEVATNGVPQLDGQEGQGGAEADVIEQAATEISLAMVELVPEDKQACVDIDQSTGDFQVEGTLVKFEDPTGLTPDVCIVTPTHTFECHMSRLATVNFFKGVQEAALAQDPPLAQPIRYQFVAVGGDGDTYHIEPLSKYPTADTRSWDHLTDDQKAAIFNELNLFISTLYGHRLSINKLEELNEIVSTLTAFAMDAPAMNEIISAGIAGQKPELGNDVVEYPAAFLEIAVAIGNRRLYLDAFCHIVGRMVFHKVTFNAITEHYPSLAPQEAVVNKYSAALKTRVEHLVTLMSAFIWPSISQTFTAESKRAKFLELRDPAPEQIRPELTMAELISTMKAYRAYLSNELGHNGRGGGFIEISGRDAQGARKKLDYFTELPIKEHDDNESDLGVPFAEFQTDFEHLT